MHISEGVLNANLLSFGAASSLLLLSLCIKNAKTEDIAKISAFSAVFFIASFIHVPIGVSSVHLVLSGLIGAFLGLNAFLSIFVALFLQALLFGYGGITTLGINAIIIALPAFFSRYLFLLKTKSKFIRKSLDFLIGFLSIFLSSALLFLVLILNGDEFLAVAYIAFVANFPLMIVEGLISLFAIDFIKKISILGK